MVGAATGTRAICNQLGVGASIQAMVWVAYQGVL
jgi:hypothetical protein